MTTPTVFAVASTSGYQYGLRPNTKSKRKRPSVVRSEPNASQDAGDQTAEYTAVITPAERTQRRLAGLPLNQDPPPPPFPHAPCPSEGEEMRRRRQKARFDSDDDDVSYTSDRPLLRHQHVTAMSAILYRCMLAQDYTRAARALGLLLRTKVRGKAIDIRYEGLWEIGAELLQRRRTEDDTESTAKHSLHPITRKGFEQAKLFYNRLMVNYPPHRTWTDAVNSLDFCMALFSSWIYYTTREAAYLRQKSIADAERYSYGMPEYSQLEAKTWELEQAKQIAEALDLQMQSILFSDNDEIMRMRANIGLWIADLIDACVELEIDEAHGRGEWPLESQDGQPGQSENMATDSAFETEIESMRADSSIQRKLVKNLLKKVELNEKK